MINYAKCPHHINDLAKQPDNKLTKPTRTRPAKSQSLVKRNQPTIFNLLEVSRMDVGLNISETRRSTAHL